MKYILSEMRQSCIKPDRKGALKQVFRRDGNEDTGNIAVIRMSLSEDFFAEVAMLTSIWHPSIVKVIRILLDGDKAWILEEWRGEPLSTFRGEEVFSLEDILSITSQMLSALTYLHEKGIMHRDIKLENILIEKDDATDSLIATLVDMNLATNLVGKDLPLSTEVYATHENRLMRPPEIETGKYGTPADMWAFGLALVELCFGELPENYLHAIRRGDNAFLEELTIDLDERLKVLIVSLLQSDPEQRAIASECLQFLSGDVKGKKSFISTLTPNIAPALLPYPFPEKDDYREQVFEWFMDMGEELDLDVISTLYSMVLFDRMVAEYETDAIPSFSTACIGLGIALTDSKVQIRDLARNTGKATVDILRSMNTIAGALDYRLLLKIPGDGSYKAYVEAV